MLRLNLLLAISFFLAGYFGSLLSIPPYHASPIWPAAGIGFAGVLTYGARIIPGIWGGVFCIRIFTSLELSTLDNILPVIIMPGIVAGSAATLQASIGAWLVKRFVGFDNALTHDGAILRFLVLAGPASCIFSASIGLLYYYSHPVPDVNYLLLSWAVWWSGDVIGVLTFAPILLCFIGRPRQKWRVRIATVALPMAVLFLLVATLFQFTRDQEQARLKILFNERVNLLQNALKNNLDRHLELNQSIRAFFDSSEHISPGEFKIFAMAILRNHPGIEALEWIPRITGNNYGHDRQLLDSVFPIHTFDGRQINISEQDHGEFFPVAYSEPNSNNRAALGFDVGSEPLQNNALRLAVDTMETKATEQIYLLPDKEKRSAIRIFTPVYNKDSPLQTVALRRQHLVGLIASSFVIENKVKKVKEQFSGFQLQLKITDGNDLLYDDAPGVSKSDGSFTVLQQTRPLNLANRHWLVAYNAAPQFYSNGLPNNIGWLLLTGLLFTGMASSFLLMLTGRTLRTQDLVKIRTSELRKESSQRQIIIRQHSDHNRILQAIASPAPLNDIINLIASTAENQFPDCLCSILLLDEQSQCLHLGAAPALPEYFVRALEGKTIGVGVCDFGTAAYTGRRIVIENIGQHEYWQNLAGLANRAGLAASWSEPILSSLNQVVGVFTVYRRSPGYPEPSLLAKVCDLVQLASIAIERRSSEKQITHLAYYDALTNLPNRRLFLDHLEKTLAGALRYQTHAALLYLDLDHFKTLNDSLGHDIGDELLIQVAKRLKQCIRDEDTVARLGGDEFVLLLSNREALKENMLEHALSTAERVQSALEVPYQLKEHIHHITPSIGITLMPQPGITPGELLKQADTAMYHAKNRGRNSISFYSSDMQRRADQRLIMEKDLRAALSEKQFSLHYQPQFDSEHRLIGAEALIRWHHPDKGMISPAEFIPVAEETSLILSISEWVLQEACEQLQKWPDLPHLAVNISPKQFRQPEFEGQISANLTKHGIASSRLMLEITEGSIIEDIDDSISKLQSMQNLGIDISIDDFGTGYSSLAYLKLLPLNQLKIDQSFVRDIIIDNNDAVIVETIISMAKHLGLSVIAEGVETAEQLQFLHDRKCKGYQGYFFSRPLTAHEFARQFIRRYDIAAVK